MFELYVTFVKIGAFMFGGENSDKYVKFLSGGERSRLAMIRLLLEPVNFLILDEPTNHLDMVSKDVLKEAIKAFDGTVIVVSHDREFLDGLVDKVYEFGGGVVREHLGGIYDYLRNKNAQTINEAICKQSSMPSAAPAPSKEAKTKEQTTNNDSKEAKGNTMTYEERKAQQRKEAKLAKRRKQLEEQIDALETRKAELDEALMKPENAANMQMVNEYTELQQQLEKLEEEYFGLE